MWKLIKSIVRKFTIKDLDNMKKKFVVVLFIFSVYFSSALDFGKRYFDADEPGSVVFYDNHTVFDRSTRGKDSINSEIEDVKSFYIDFKGIKKLTINEKDEKSKNYLILDCKIDSVEFLTLLKPTKTKYRNWVIPYTYFDSKKYNFSVIPVLWRVSVKEASSFVQEESKNGMQKYLPEAFGLFSLPWAVSEIEKKKIITFACETQRNDFEPVQDLIIVNGFVCAEKESLFKDNCRAKKIKITYSEVSFDYELEDSANYQVIHLPQKIMPCKNDLINLEILDVYKGDKYQDVVISGIYFPEIHK
ncbi:MAG: hypothetical protein IJP90_12220 [Treponema sp.]|nr:hypothetical protein [Treponema sp.]